MIERGRRELGYHILQLCDALGISRQAYYQRIEAMQRERYQLEIVLELVAEQRKLMPRVGGKKLYSLLKRDFEVLEYKLGRDRLFDVLRDNDLLIKRRKSYTKTTNSFHHYYVYKNLILDLAVTRINQVFVADITYLRVGDGFMYLHLVTDLYSRRIVGWCLSETLDAAGSVLALKMALSEVSVAELDKLIHHSDRGVQYCCKEYTGVLLENKISISMAEIGNPYENAVAERVNGILKDEFYLDQRFLNQHSTLRATQQAIKVYNDIRPHLSLKMKRPSEVYFENTHFSNQKFSPLKGGRDWNTATKPEGSGSYKRSTRCNTEEFFINN